MVEIHVVDARNKQEIECPYCTTKSPYTIEYRKLRKEQKENWEDDYADWLNSRPELDMPQNTGALENLVVKECWQCHGTFFVLDEFTMIIGNKYIQDPQMAVVTPPGEPMIDPSTRTYKLRHSKPTKED